MTKTLHGPDHRERSALHRRVRPLRPRHGGPSLLQYEEWGVTPSALGTLGSVTAMGMPIGSILAGWMGDRYGRRRPLVLFLSVISSAMLLAALAPNLATFAVARVLTGLGFGALAPLVAALVADHAPAKRRALYIASSMSAIGIGGATSALLGRLLLPQTPFQWIFAVGALPLLLVPVVWRLLPVSANTSIASGAERARARELVAPGRRWATLVLCLATFLSFALIYSTNTWLPTVMIRSGYDLTSAMEFYIAFALGAGIGATSLSLLGDKGHLRSVTVCGFLVGAAALLALSTQQPRVLLLLLCALAGAGSLGTQALVVACMASHYPPAVRATGMGLTLGLGRAGAIVGPLYLSAVTAMITSPKAGFYAFAVPAVLGALAIFILPRSRDVGAARAAQAALS
ncbi:MFS transporter [Streptomyces sp. NPDC057002]|uniref:MFS transporter n=1 Tax=Streptomyces sp. NPDC057002 TaxID=3345992 RepID=UPI00362F9CB3